MSPRTSVSRADLHTKQAPSFPGPRKAIPAAVTPEQVCKTPFNQASETHTSALIHLAIFLSVPARFLRLSIPPPPPPPRRADQPPLPWITHRFHLFYPPHSFHDRHSGHEGLGSWMRFLDRRCASRPGGTSTTFPLPLPVTGPGPGTRPRPCPLRRHVRVLGFERVMEDWRYVLVEPVGGSEVRVWDMRDEVAM